MSYSPYLEHSQPKTRNQARQMWSALDLRLSDITKEDAVSLKAILATCLGNSELTSHIRVHETLVFRSGELVELYCSADNFEKREAYTFNSDGFVGIAGWADAQNVTPFIVALHEWAKNMHEKVLLDILKKKASE